MPPPVPLRILASRCLLGDAVRYDGGHREALWLSRAPREVVVVVPVCPEVAAGLGTPREPMTLEGPIDAPRLLGNTSRRDSTAALRAASAALLEEVASLGAPELIVLKARSPSCGVGSVARGGVNGQDGLFAEAAGGAFPGVPRCDETLPLDFEGRSRIFTALRAHRRARGVETSTVDRWAAWLAAFDAGRAPAR